MFVWFSYLFVLYVGKICKEQQVILSKMAGMIRCKLWYLNCIAGPPTLSKASHTSKYFLLYVKICQLRARF